jgi:hypothetical protein
MIEYVSSPRKNLQVKIDNEKCCDIFENRVGVSEEEVILKKFITVITVIASFAIMASSLMTINTNDVHASGYTTKKTTYNWHANARYVSAWFTLHATGYSYPNSGRVTSRWIDSGAAIGHSVVNKKTWTAKTPRGTHVYGQATNFYGVDSQWVKVPLKQDTKTIGLQF